MRSETRADTEPREPPLVGIHYCYLFASSAGQAQPIESVIQFIRRLNVGRIEHWDAVRLPLVQADPA